MNWDKANKNQLLQIALSESCSIDFKYRACSELQVRWSEDMLTDVVVMYGKGNTPTEIADYLGVRRSVVRGIISHYNLRRVEHEPRKII